MVKIVLLSKTFHRKNLSVNIIFIETSSPKNENFVYRAISENPRILAVSIQAQKKKIGLCKQNVKENKKPDQTTEQNNFLLAS